MSDPSERLLHERRQRDSTAQVQGPLTYLTYPNSYQYNLTPAAIPATTAYEVGEQERMRNAEDECDPVRVPVGHLNVSL